jgi:probable F420-dependent oxidoreductase
VKVGIALIESYRFASEPRELGIAGLAARARRIEEIGFDGILSSETAGHDPFFPLLLAAEHTERVRLSTGVAIAFPRAPMVVAQMSWDLQRLSRGRFTLGLGTQVKGQSERRYGVPWTSAPGPRLAEYVACLRAIFHSFQHPEAPRWFRGEQHRFDLLPPVFRPEPIEHPHVPIQIAAVNPYMSRLAGEACDGVFAHPICTPRYLREVMLPTVRAGARSAGRPESAVEIVHAPIVVTGRDRQELEREQALHRRRVAFYASTRTYHPVFELHGWKELGTRLHALSLEGRWDEMTKLVPEEMAAEFATIAALDELGPALREKWSGLLDTINLPTDLPLDTDQDRRRVRAVVEALQGA